MKKSVLSFKIKSSLLLMMVFSQVAVFATTFTATTSGNYSSGTTWGGTAPSFNISTDAVIIPSGFTVTLDGNATFTGALASMQVEGALSSVQGAVLNVGPLATLSGAGAINVSALNLQAGAITTFSGAAVLDSINTSVANLQVVAGLTVSNKVNLAAGTLSVATGGSITMMPGVTINVAAGVLTLNGGTVTLPASYNVVYSTGAITTGLELGGPGLHDITVAVGAGNMLNLSSDLTTSGTLSLVSGDLFIGNHDLTVNGDVAAGGNGAIASSVLSNISVTAAGGLSGTLNFADSTNVNDLTINVGTGNHVTLGGVLNVAGNLTLTSGTFNIGNGSLSINGAVMPGAGYLGGTASSTLSVNSASGIIGPLNFATGAQTVGDFTVNLGFGIQISLVSDLEVKGTLNILNSGGLAINSVTLTVDGDLIGSGNILTNDSSGLVLNINNGPTGYVNLGSHVIGSLTINIGTGNTTLSSSLAISDTLNLQSGTLVSGNNFTLLGTLTGNGNIYTTSSAKVSINTAGGIGGALNFASGSVANKLIVDIGFGNAVTISGPLNVLDTLKLVTGTLNIGNGSLTISGEISGIGNLAGTTSSDLMINTSADVELDFAAGGQTLNNLIVNTGAGNSVTLGTSLTITGVLSLANQNSLDISGESLTLSGDLTGSGLLTVNTGTTLIINGPNGLSTPVVLSGIIGTFILNTGSSDSVVLGSDLNVSNLISLQNGILVLHGNDLGITGDIASGGNGTISSNSLSNVMINTTGALSGGLAFTGGSNTVNNFSLHTMGNLVVAGSFNVDSVLTLNGGKIDIGSDTVFVAAGGYVSGGDSSSYVIATNGGALSLHLDTAYTGWLGFAIGTQANYAPVSAQLNAGSVSADFYASVNSGVDSMGMGGTNISATQPVVDLTWLVEPSVASGVSINLITTWSSSVEVNGFHRDSAYISHYTNAQWDLSATSPAIAATGTYYFSQRNSITSFSPFAVFEKRNNITTAIEANVNDVFLVYPNPASDNLIIKNTADTRGVNVDIINVTGQVMGRYTLTDLTTNVSLTGLTAGDYFVKIYNNNMSVVKPFIKM